MIGYFDSSALVKLVVEEARSEEAAALWDGADAVLSSRVAYPEVRGALAAARRAGRLTGAQLAEAKRMWTPLWDAVRVVELSADLAVHAGDLAEEHALSGFDAVHLASALLVSEGELILATWDSRLQVAARSSGLRVLPAEP